ncbi:MAG TPA: pyridoxal phosphate-dependent aminotransferase [Candidatus Krumholzibacteria bacterium]|nr:pyridoxal phosphate-dependent aminotransferase [Candidatus Krumholzibacteria bacterium]HPD71472.1 pyridoxal phosphate-dependent aminotransferase [Candidatus Krumholzibacteria bacterium]HRY41595.1 pyridoxal phosphate-dependent aminotransferase [Candidatus Krumholzibacteria bacterium]
MSLRLGWLAEVLGDSPTLNLSSQAQALIKAGEPVINLTAGEPDFPTPDPVLAAARAALADGHIRYTASAGIPELREKVAAYYTAASGLPYAANEVIVSNGAKQVLFNALSVLLNEGDRVAIPVPYWVSYPAQVTALRGKVIEVAPSRGWKVTPEDLERSGAREARALILNSPVNPTGAVYDRAELAAIAEWCRSGDFFILADEIYEDLVYTGAGHVSLVQVAPDLRHRIVRISGLSKSYAMTGWRVGFGLADKPTIDAMTRLQSHSTSNVCTIAQKAALAAFDCRPQVAEMRQAFHRRRDALVAALAGVGGVRFAVPDGAFYLMLDCSEVIDPARRREGCWRLASHLLEKQKLATIPGEAFGAPGCLRISFARSEAELREAVARLRVGLRGFPG